MSLKKKLRKLEMEKKAEQEIDRLLKKGHGKWMPRKSKVFRHPELFTKVNGKEIVIQDFSTLDPPSIRVAAGILGLETVINNEYPNSVALLKGLKDMVKNRDKIIKIARLRNLV